MSSETSGKSLPDNEDPDSLVVSKHIGKDRNLPAGQISSFTVSRPETMVYEERHPAFDDESSENNESTVSEPLLETNQSMSTIELDTIYPAGPSVFPMANYGGPIQIAGKSPRIPR